MQKTQSYIIRTNDIVKVNNQLIKEKLFRYYIYNKPSGCICTNDRNNELSIFHNLNKPKGYISATEDLSQKTVLDLVPEKFKFRNLFPAGRLDKDTEGLIIITNDGKFSHDILDKENHIEKEYEVYLRDTITNTFLSIIQTSFNLSGKQTIPAKISSYTDKTINLVIYEGMHHQIKRIVSLSNNKVIKLKRVRIGNLTLQDLDKGKIKEIPTLKEVIR